MTTDIQPSYTERAGKLGKAARKTAFKNAAKCLLKYKEATAEIGSLRVDRLNRLREAGLQFNIGSGREQLAFNIEGIEFTRKEILPLMPDGIGVEEVHACVLIANKMKEPAKTPAEVDALERQFQVEFEMLGLVPSHKRKELQSSHARNLFSEFVNITSGLTVKMTDLEKEEPMERWPAFKLDEFLETTVPVVAMVEKAKQLRMKAGMK